VAAISRSTGGTWRAYAMTAARSASLMYAYTSLGMTINDVLSRRTP
jgi:hypothetical protein